MNLAEWVGLCANERNALRKKWCQLHGEGYSEGDEMFALVTEAAAQFAAKYGQHPQIYFVEGYGIEEPRIGVMTSLHTGEVVEDIPSLYATFQVHQWPMETNKAYYLQVWQLVLSTLLGWSEAKVFQWAQQYEDDLNGQHGSMFYHESPCYYVSFLLIPQDLRDAERQGHLASEIQAAIEDQGREPVRINDYNWDNARARIDAAVARFRQEQQSQPIKHCCPTMSATCQSGCDWPVRVRFSSAIPLNTKYQLLGRAETDEGPCIFHCPWCGTKLSTVSFSVPTS